ncbi:MAG: ATP-binding protein [Kofleriaceae bacterium]
MTQPPGGDEPRADEDARTRAQVTLFHQAALVVELSWCALWYLLGFPLTSVVSLAGAAGYAVSLALLRRGRLATYIDVGAALSLLDVFATSLTSPGNAPPATMFLVFAPIYGWILSTRGRTRLWTVAAVVLTLASAGINAWWPLTSETAVLSPGHALLITASQGLAMIALALVAMKMLTQNHAAMLAVVTDQKDVLRAQKNVLRAKHDELTHSQRYKDRFFAAVSHELRTPMNAITGIAQLLRAPELDPAEHGRLLDALASSSGHLLGVIDDLLDLARLNERKVVLVAAPFALASTVTAAFQMARRADPAVEFRCEVAPDLPPFVRGDSRRVAQVLVNLVGNAAKFTRAGSVTLRVDGAPAGDGPPDAWTLVFTVTDTGIGISADRVASLFQDFVQADESIAVQYGGTGLGLAISRRLVELMGGTLACTSELGRGSRFAVTLPLQACAEPAPAAVARTTAAPGKRVIVVDDHQLNRFVIRRQLERQFPGIVVDEAGDGVTALAAVAATGYDLVLMDMQMPVMDGREATRQIRALADADRAAVPIVAMTANADASDLAACIAAGMDHALPKPVPLPVLADVINQFLGLLPAAATARPEPHPAADG